jgi:hypothetical protein
MYMYAAKGVGQALAQPLTVPELSAEIRESLSQVRTRCREFKPLLLIAVLHPRPRESQIWAKQQFTLANTSRFLNDILLFDAEPALVARIEQGLVKALQQIAEDCSRTDRLFKNQVIAEMGLRNDIARTLPLELRRHRLSGPPRFKALLLNMLFLPKRAAYFKTMTAEWRANGIAWEFAETMLPTLADRLRRSTVREAHLSRLGDSLRRYALSLAKFDADFERQVRKMETHEQQWRREQERKRKERTPRRP